MKLFILLILLLPCVTAANIYKSVDADGNTVYTDIAEKENTEALDLSELTVIKTDKVRKKTPFKKIKTTSKRENPSNHDYKSIKIKPENNQTIRDNAGAVTISVTLHPMLNTEFGDRLIIEMDGVIINNSNTSTVSLTNVDRGTHNVTARITNPNDTSIKNVASITFHLKRQTAKRN